MAKEIKTKRRRVKHVEIVSIRYVEPNYASDAERQAAVTRANEALGKLARLLGRMAARDAMRGASSGGTTASGLPGEAEQPSASKKAKTRRTKKEDAVSIDHLHVACRHAEEMISAGVTESAANRTLEHLLDLYARLLLTGSVVNEIPIERWSLAARAVRAEDPNTEAIGACRVEHWTSRRAFVRNVLELFRSGKLSETTINGLIREHWQMAVITRQEETRLSKVSKERFASPQERWRAARILF